MKLSELYSGVTPKITDDACIKGIQGGRLYHGLDNKPFSKGPWQLNGEDMIPNKINALDFVGEATVTGKGATPQKAYNDALFNAIGSDSDVLVEQIGFDYNYNSSGDFKNPDENVIGELKVQLWNKL